MTSASDELAQSLEELRELARGSIRLRWTRGWTLRWKDLPGARRSPPPCRFEPGPRLPEPVAFAAYFVASEALANVIKYAHASAATVRLLRTDAGVSDPDQRRRCGRGRPRWRLGALRTRRPRRGTRRPSPVSSPPGCRNGGHSGAALSDDDRRLTTQSVKHQPLSLRVGLPAQEGQDGENAAIVVGALVQAQLGEHGADIGLHGLRAQVELVTDRLVRSALRHH